MPVGDQLMKSLGLTLVAVLFVLFAASLWGQSSNGNRGGYVSSGTAGQPAVYTGTNTIGPGGITAGQAATIPTESPSIPTENYSAYNAIGNTFMFPDGTYGITYRQSTVEANPGNLILQTSSDQGRHGVLKVQF